MSLPKTVYDVLKAVMTTDTRLAHLEEQLAGMSDKVEANATKAAALLANHSERLARIEGKFELLEHTLSNPRRRLPEKSG